MLPKAHRLKKENDFGRVLRFGRKGREDFLAVRFLRNDSNGTRFGVAVSKKVSKKATTRNKIKRRVLEVCRGEISRIRPGVDVIIFALPGMQQKNFPETKDAVEKLFLKTGLMPPAVSADGKNVKKNNSKND